jgi:hypothetical protein
LRQQSWLALNVSGEVEIRLMVAEMPKKDSGTPAMPGGGMGGMDY